MGSGGAQHTGQTEAGGWAPCEKRESVMDSRLQLLACTFSLQLLAAVVSGSDVTLSPPKPEDTPSALLSSESSSFLTNSQSPHSFTVQPIPHRKDLLNISSVPSGFIWPTASEPHAPTSSVQVRSVEVQPHSEDLDSGVQAEELDREQALNSKPSTSESLGSLALPTTPLAEDLVQELVGCPGCQKPEGISEEEPFTQASLDLIKGAEGSGETSRPMRGSSTLKEKQDAKLFRYEEATDFPAQGTEGSTDYTRVDQKKQLWSEQHTIPAQHLLTTNEPSKLPTGYIHDLNNDSSENFPIVESPDVSITSSNLDSTNDFLSDLPSLTPPLDHRDSGVEMATLYYWDEMAPELERENEFRLTTVSPKVQTILVKEEDMAKQTISSPDFISESYLTVFTNTSDSDSGQDISLSPLVLGEDRKDCKLGYLKQNKTCKSICDLAPNYCYNGGQCFVMEDVGAICRCNAQDYIWHKGIRCEFIITEFQVMCIAIGSSAAVILLLFMLTVFFAKKVYSLKTENKKLRNRSKYRPQLEQHNDNFSLSTIAEGSQANDDVNGQNKIHESLKTCPKDDDSFNVQNNWTPKQKESANAEVNSAQNNVM
ncbi:uncharacterized protein LOC134343832 [Mobula hypostoma]|uniref:uncharacterized protein LOC134343832 n=1 Tax=Mobula hypostoma TaxID=723540 RepID=UPI002FC38FFC